MKKMKLGAYYCTAAVRVTSNPWVPDPKGQRENIF